VVTVFCTPMQTAVWDTATRMCVTLATGSGKISGYLPESLLGPNLDAQRRHEDWVRDVLEQRLNLAHIDFVARPAWQAGWSARVSSLSAERQGTNRATQFLRHAWAPDVIQCFD
jgi:hypothetical protein